MNRLTKEQEAAIRARRQAVDRDNWEDVPPLDHEGCSVWPWDDETSLNFAYAAPKDVALLLAEIDELRREIDALRTYGNRDCINQADEALAAGYPNS